MQRIKQVIKTLLPKALYERLLGGYHWLWALAGVIIYRNPSKKITLIGVTGTKGKSTVTEILGHILRADGKSVATLSTIQFSVDGQTERNLFKMTMPGRFFVQRFLRRAVDAGCTHAVVEMTSEGAKQHRHRFLQIDSLIFTNLTPEHIESHGSFAKYKAAKLSIARAVARSKKRPRHLVANVDDEHGESFLDFTVEYPLPYSLKDLSLYTLHKDSMTLVLDDKNLRVPLIGLFNVYNVLAAITMARALDVSLETIQNALEKLPVIAGRVEKFYSPEHSERNITAVVDYAHTPDSLTKLYETFKDQPLVCVLGNTGGGRDTWKRPEMAAIAEKYCREIILTNEDPYDEEPRKILSDMEAGIENKEKVTIELNRRAAIELALLKTPPEGVAIISGKGTDPYIMGPNGTKEPWSDATVVKESLAKVFATNPDNEPVDVETSHHS
jgi:UDP-N-acetylmuramoyl-L-alanyl-D-glutamate--2,6-diaminopimelate ligase